MLTDFLKKFSLLERKMKFRTKPFHHTLQNFAALPCEIQTFENDTNCAEITIKSYIFKFHTSGNVVGSTMQLLMLLQHPSKIPPSAKNKLVDSCATH